MSSNVQNLHKPMGTMKNQGNMTLPKEHSKCLVTDSKETEIQELPDKEFKIIVLKMLKQRQEKSDKQF